MALRVWLPLNGNIENKGLSNYQFINNEATLDNNGKIGKSYLFNGTSSRISTTGVSLPNNFSISLWFCCASISDTSQWLFCLNNNNGTSTEIQGGVYITSSNIFHNCGGQGTYQYSISTGTWYHIVQVVDNATSYLYINGELKHSFTGTKVSCPNFTIGARSNSVSGAATSATYYFNGRINDVRIYDEALSPKQIKDISKGLVAHYQLVGTGANPNLLLHSDQYTDINPRVQTGTGTDIYNVLDMYYNGLDTSKNYILSVCSDGTLDSSHAGSTSKDVTKRYWTIWLYYSNTTYTDSNCGSYDNPICYTSADNSTSKTYLGKIGNRYYWKIKPGYPNCSVRVNAYSNGTDTVSVKFWDIKLEEGTTLTSWIPNENDNLYKALGYNSDICTDVSGNGYTAIKSGTLIFNNDSPRYSGSTVFDTNISYLKLPVMATAGFANSFTIVYWTKITDMNAKMAWGFEDGNRLNIYPSSSVFCCNTGDGSNNQYKNNGTAVAFSPYNNSWHQYAMVGDGSTNKLYIDGVYAGTATTYKGITGTQIYISGWDTGTSYKWTGGSISDFRIYATALSADDIKELYQIHAYIDNNNKTYSYEFIEGE